MDKMQFMTALSYAVRDMPGEEQERLLWQYEARFVEAMQRGESEQDIANRLGHPHIIARHAKLKLSLKQFPAKLHPGSLLRYFGTLVLLCWLNLLMVVPLLTYLMLLICANVLALFVNVAGIAVIFFALNGTSQLRITVPESVSLYGDPEILGVSQLDWSRHGVSWQDLPRVNHGNVTSVLVNLHFSRSEIWYGVQLCLLGALLSLLSWYWNRLSWRALKRLGSWQWRQLDFTTYRPVTA